MPSSLDTSVDSTVYWHAVLRCKCSVKYISECLCVAQYSFRKCFLMSTHVPSSTSSLVPWREFHGADGFEESFPRAKEPILKGRVLAGRVLGGRMLGAISSVEVGRSSKGHSPFPTSAPRRRWLGESS